MNDRPVRVLRARPTSGWGLALPDPRLGRALLGTWCLPSLLLFLLCTGASATVRPPVEVAIASADELQVEIRRLERSFAPAGGGKLAQLSMEHRQLIARLIEKATKTGTVNVIVGLKLAQAYAPEARLPDRAAVERQRAAIAQARDALLASLRTGSATEYARWDTLPLAALRVDAAALRLLADTSLITTIQEEGLSGPQ